MPNNACFSSTSSVGMWVMLACVVLCVIICLTVGVKRLQHVLRALADFFPEMGYCQGTGMV